MTLKKDDDETAWEIEEATGIDLDGAMDEIMEEAAGQADAPTGLEVDLAAAKAEAAEWQDRFMRKAAEFENYRKRMDREKAELRIASQSAILRNLLPVLDGFDRALKYFSGAERVAGSVEQYREGIELLFRQVLDALAQAGVAPIEAEGKPFDPHLHEALSREETSEVADGTIVSELRRGYMFNETLLRPSQVIVAVQLQVTE
ncbi:MAG: nucleotide exchange factor GrpE [Acidobacteriota bacterium]|jgi:molecular chaperone GrpE|nr:nucleotide exchange factor GrpE [Acidobacteriota bacterium]